MLEKKLESEIKAGAYIDIHMDFVAPKSAGKFCSFYRFAYGKNDRFG